MTLSVEKAFATENATVTFSNGSCTSSSNATHYFITTQYTECGTQLQQTNTTIRFTNIVTVSPSNTNPHRLIYRLENIIKTIFIVCIIPKNTIATTNAVIDNPGNATLKGFAFGEWSPWSACSVSCGTLGLQISTRNCSATNNETCIGNATKYQSCPRQPCTLSKYNQEIFNILSLHDYDYAETSCSYKYCEHKYFYLTFR